MEHTREIILERNPFESILTRRHHQRVDRLTKAIGLLEFGGEHRV
jgi:hypothetical protein